MFDHVGIQVADVEAALGFYTSVFAPLGFTEAMRIPTPDGPVVGLAVHDGPPGFWLAPSAGGPTRENHIAFAAAGREVVDAVYAAARAADAEVLHAPREWPEYHEGYYAVFVRDHDGHNVEAVCHH